jgi:twitching motility protein PilI
MDNFNEKLSAPVLHDDIPQIPAAAIDINAEQQELRRIWKIGFCISRWRLLIAENTECQVMNKPSIYALPGVEPWLVGVANIRGFFVPCFDLAKYLGAELSANPKLLLVGKGENSVGLLIDGYPSREGFFAGENLIEPHEVSPTILPHCFAQYQRNSGEYLESWIEIDYQSLVFEMAKQASLRT